MHIFVYIVRYIYFAISLPIRHLLKHVPIYPYKIGCCTLQLCELKLYVKKSNLLREKFGCCSLAKFNLVCDNLIFLFDNTIFICDKVIFTIDRINFTYDE